MEKIAIQWVILSDQSGFQGAIKIFDETGKELRRLLVMVDANRVKLTPTGEEDVLPDLTKSEKLTIERMARIYWRGANRKGEITCWIDTNGDPPAEPLTGENAHYYAS